MPRSKPQLRENTYLSLLQNFTDFLTVTIHTILFHRSIYPSQTFIRAKKYNFQVYQSRHPKVCSWITDSVSAVQDELLQGMVERVAIVIVSPHGTPVERFVFDVSRFAAVDKAEWHTEIERESLSPAPLGEEEVAEMEPPSVNMEEQLRAVLAKLSSCATLLKPVPAESTFTIAVELKDKAEPPIRHPQPWMPVQPSLQRLVDGLDEEGIETKDENDPRSLKTVPVRAVDAGEMVFEMWIEEGRGKDEALALAALDKKETISQTTN